MEDQRQKITNEINEVLKKYSVEGAFIGIILKGESSGFIYDDAFLMKGNIVEVAKGIQKATIYENRVHALIDLIIKLHIISKEEDAALAEDCAPVVN